MNLKPLKVGLVILVFTFAALGILIWLSPYKTTRGKTKAEVATSVIIRAPVDVVFSYLGNSNNAADWSVFVDHISPINGDEIPDGQVGSIRRCFKNKDEQGLYWDEENLEVRSNKIRRLSVYNLSGFKLSAEGLITEQVFRSVSKDTTELTFSLYFEKDSPSWLDQLKMYYSAFSVRDIYDANMSNIKDILENKK